MSALHVGILLAFAACLLWSARVMVAVLADLSSARRPDADPAAAQDQRECSPMGVNARGTAQCSEGHGDYPDACDEAHARSATTPPV